MDEFISIESKYRRLLYVILPYRPLCPPFDDWIPLIATNFNSFICFRIRQLPYRPTINVIIVIA